MSEYQYYEFQAIDRPLSTEEIAELQKLSTRATITPTRFTNVYHFGDFRGKPETLMERHFDVFVYIANWGTHRLMLRLPGQALELETASPYCPEEGARAWEKGDWVILEFISRDEDAGGWVEDEEAEAWIPSFIPLREDIAGGDLRALYLGWLHCAQDGWPDDDAEEPPIPPGLRQLPASLRTFADFLRIDEDLIAVAAERSRDADTMSPTTNELAEWIRDIPEPEKDALLLRAIEGRAPHLQGELLRRFRGSKSAPILQAGGRSVRELIEAAEARRGEKTRGCRA